MKAFILKVVVGIQAAGYGTIAGAMFGLTLTALHVVLHGNAGALMGIVLSLVRQ